MLCRRLPRLKPCRHVAGGERSLIVLVAVETTPVAAVLDLVGDAAADYDCAGEDDHAAQHGDNEVLFQLRRQVIRRRRRRRLRWRGTGSGERPSASVMVMYTRTSESVIPPVTEPTARRRAKRSTERTVARAATPAQSVTPRSTARSMQGRRQHEDAARIIMMTQSIDRSIDEGRRRRTYERSIDDDDDAAGFDISTECSVQINLLDSVRN